MRTFWSLNRFRRMATVYPYRDMSWLVVMTFTITNTTFLLNTFFNFLPTIARCAIFSAESTIASPTTLSIGATLFIFGILMGFLATSNVDRGQVSSHDHKLANGGFDTGPSTTYQPELLGSSSFVWLPPPTELKTIYLPNIAFQAGLIQLAGAAIFSVANFSSEPGVIAPSHKPAFIFLPTAIGGLCFFGAGVALWLWRKRDGGNQKSWM